jgi:hypothetical protein
MNAKFQAEATFIIKGRGLVLSGWIVEGTVKRDMVISIPSFPRMLRIEGIEMIRTVNLPPGLVGLVFSFADDQDTALWEQLDVKGKIFEVEEKKSNFQCQVKANERGP